MPDEIVVILKRRDRIEEILPYITKLARPVMRVLFLVPYPVDSGSYLRDHWITTESKSQAKAAGTKLIRRYAWDVQREIAERKLAAAEEALRRLQIEVDVELYTGGLKRAAKTCKEKNGDQLIMASVAGDTLWERLAAKIPGLRPAQRRRFSPVMLMHVSSARP
jgi:hypothetical protein